MDEDKKIYLDFLKEIYVQANTHLLEQGKKRDQVVTFYIILFSFVLTNLGHLRDDFLGKPTILLIYITLIIIGLIVIWILADLRSWHTQYLGAIYTINWMFANEAKCKNVKSMQDNMKWLMEQPLNHGISSKIYDPKVLIQKYVFGSTANMIYSGIIFLVSLPLLGIFGYLKLSGITSFILFVVFFIVIFYVSEIHLAKKLNAGEKYNTWILSFDYNGKVK